MNPHCHLSARISWVRVCGSHCCLPRRAHPLGAIAALLITRLSKVANRFEERLTTAF
jgi:hypothetical protein